MAAGEIRADLVGDSREFVRSVDKGTEAVEDLVDELKDASQQGDKTERDFADNFRDIARAADKTGKSVKKDLKEGLKGAGSEAGQSGREAAASFSGGFEDVGDFVQETLANALGDFGPLGAAAGVALAAIVGTVLAQAQAAQEALEASRERAIGLAQQMYEDGGPIPLTQRVSELIEVLGSERNAADPLESLANGFLDLGTNLDQTRRAAAAADIPLAQLLRGLTGADIDSTRQQLEGVMDALERVNAEDHTVVTEEWYARRKALEGVRTELEKVQTAAELAGELADTARIIPQVTPEQLANIEAAAGAMVDAKGSIDSFIHAGEEGVKLPTVDFAGWLAQLEGQTTTANEVKKSLLSVPPEVATEADRIWKEQGLGAADIFLDGFQQQSPEMQARIVEQLGLTGTAAGAAGASSLQGAFDQSMGKWTPPTIVVPVVGDTTAWDAVRKQIEQWDPNVKTVDIQTTINGRPGMWQPS